jgi:hypothetical protein
MRAVDFPICLGPKMKLREYGVKLTFSRTSGSYLTSDSMYFPNTSTSYILSLDVHQGLWSSNICAIRIHRDLKSLFTGTLQIFKSKNFDFPEGAEEWESEVVFTTRQSLASIRGIMIS